MAQEIQSQFNSYNTMDFRDLYLSKQSKVYEKFSRIIYDQVMADSDIPQIQKPWLIARLDERARRQLVLYSKATGTTLPYIRD